MAPVNEDDKMAPTSPPLEAGEVGDREELQKRLDALTARTDALQDALSKKQAALTEVLRRNEALKALVVQTRRDLGDRLDKVRAAAAQAVARSQTKAEVAIQKHATLVNRLETVRAANAEASTKAQAKIAATAELTAKKQALLEEVRTTNAKVAAKYRAKFAATAELAAKKQALLEKVRTTNVEVVAKYRTTIAVKSEIYSKASPYLGIYRQGLLADEIARSELDFSADCYVALLPSSVPAALQLKRKHGGIVICDCVENVEVHKHSIAPRIHPPALELVNLAAYGALAESDGLLTIGNALARTLDRFGSPVQVIPNFRRYEEAVPKGELRAACRVGPDDILLFASGNVVVGFEPVLEALARLPANVHLAALVRLKPADYEEQMLLRIKELGLSERVHFFPFVPYDQLASVAADCDVGLITSDVTNPNGAVALPNRLFDYLTAGLPVVVPPMPDVVELVEKYGFGRALPVVTSENWYQALADVMANLPAFKAAALAARAAITWENNEDALFDFLGRPRRVTFVGFRDFTRYQRFQRMAVTLTARGAHVKAVCLSVDPAPNTIPGVEVYHFEDRYGRGPGLRRVPDIDPLHHGE